MKPNTKRTIKLTVLGLIFALLTINTQNISINQETKEEKMEILDEMNLKSSGYWNPPYISIDGNWSLTEQNKPWCNGSGTWDEPYIIQNVTIDAGMSPTGSGILINNSKNVYFIIRNCTIYNAKSGAYDAGIRLENTNNGTLTDNNCSNNGYHGIFLYNYCKNNTLSGNIANENSQIGIYLNDGCDNNTIYNNTASDNTQHGIKLYLYCHNNTIFNNTANDNTQHGISLQIFCHDNMISDNTANDNGVGFGNGINLDADCDNNTISGNNASNSITSTQNIGIRLTNGCDNNTISDNTVNHNTEYGIRLTNSYRAELSGNQMNMCGVMIEGTYAQKTSHTIYYNNTVNGRALYYYVNEKGLDAINFSGSGQVILFNCNNSVISNLNISHTSTGIYLENCYNNALSGNIANDNADSGIMLRNCDNNTIFNNTANDNTDSGIWLSDSDNNTISGNIVNNNNNFVGIFLSFSNNNTISGNIANKNIGYGLYLEESNNNTVSGNIANNNTMYGIYIQSNCNNNTISGNIAGNNTMYGLFLDDNCDNNIITENYIYFNTLGAIRIDNANCNDNIIKRNILVSEDEIFINDFGTNTVFSLNYYLPTLPQLSVEIIDQSFSTTEFIIIIKISSSIDFDFYIQSIQIWWNGIDVPSNNIDDLENGLYNISLTPIFVEPGEDPILLNMTISAEHYKDKYYELNITVDPEAVKKGGGDGNDDDDGDDDGLEGASVIIILGIAFAIAGILGGIGITIFLRKKDVRTAE